MSVQCNCIFCQMARELGLDKDSSNEPIAGVKDMPNGFVRVPVIIPENGEIGFLYMPKEAYEEIKKKADKVQPYHQN